MKIINCKLKINHGFTIVEFLVYMAMFAIFIGVLSQVLVAVLDVQTESQATSAVEQDGRFLLSRFTYDINRASAIVTPTTNGTSGATLQLTIGGVAYIYSVNANTKNLEINVGGVPDPLNNYGTQISNLNFTRLGNVGKREDTITVSFTITSVAKRNSGPETANFKTTIALRRN